MTHGPLREVNFKKKVTVMAARKALACVMSSRVKDGSLLVIDSLDLASGKTKDAAKAVAGLAKELKGYKAGNRVLLLTTGDKDDAMLRRAVNNLPNVDLILSRRT